MPPAISVQNLGKCYRINHEAKSRGTGGYRTVRESLINFATAPARRLRGKSVSQASLEDFWALEDVSFDVNPGEVVGIIGRNGAGKSTLLKILSRITKPTCGHIEIRGRVGSLLEVGTGFHPELTGKENIYLNGSILGMSRQEIARRFDEIVAFAEVEKFLDTPVKRYSSGMYTRLAFSVAAHLEPEILIVDEVLAVGDTEFQRKCLGKMQDVASGGRTVLFVSHDMTNILRLGTSAIHLRTGKLRLVGGAKEVVDDYLHSSKNEFSAVVRIDAKTRQREQPGKAEIVQVEYVSESGVPWKLAFGEALKLRVVVKLTSNVPRLEVGLAIFTAMGFEIASSLSSHVIDRCDWEPGFYTFDAIYQGLRLLPGRFRLNIGVRSGMGMEDHVTDAAEFEVVTSDLAGKLNASSFRGVLVPNVEYKVSYSDAYP